MRAIAMARPMPGMAPSTATPTRRMIESHSHGWMRRMRLRSATSIKPIAEGDDDRRQRGLGQFCNRFGAVRNRKAMISAATTLVSWLRARAASATGVRGAAAADREALKNPAARLAGPSPTISWLGST